ncbi:hypothetical protein BGX26_004816 [Mortierella sp. AD094]|nr:hypothetical protein BGX26_004816 [Mortierella sp. AD094]
MATQPEIYSVKVSLLGSKPKVWRRVLVNSASTLGEFHVVIQSSMGWGNCHMHQCNINGRFYQSGPLADLDLDLGDLGMEIIDGDKVRLSQFAAPGSKFLYEYDMGDSWEHEIFVEKVVPFTPSLRHFTEWLEEEMGIENFDPKEFDKAMAIIRIEYIKDFKPM